MKKLNNKELYNIVGGVKFSASLLSSIIKGANFIFELGRLYVRQGKDELAENFLKKGVRLEENSIYSKFELAKLYSRQEKFKDSEKLFKECLEKAPKDVYTRLELGKIYVKTDFLKAEEILTEALRMDPYNNLVRLELGNLYVNNKKTFKAETVFKTALRMDSNFTNGMIALAKLYISQCRHEEGRKLLKKCIKIDKTDLSPRIELAKLDEYKKLNPKAKDMYNYLFENINIEEYNELQRKRFMQSHWSNDLTKNKYGVFTKSFEEIRKNLNSSEAKKSEFCGSEIYCIKLESCGYEGGSKGDGHQLDYVTIVTKPQKKDLLIMFPSDEIVIEKEKNQEIEDFEDER